MLKLTQTTRRQKDRAGATLVETAIVLPVFFMLIFAFIEFGHVYLTIHTMNTAARKAARMGIGENTTTAQVDARLREIIGSAIDLEHVTVMIKDGSIFEDPDTDPSTVDYSSLPDLELADAEPRQLFIVRVSVPYSEVGIMGPRWVTALTVRGQSVQRKE